MTQKTKFASLQKYSMQTKLRIEHLCSFALHLWAPFGKGVGRGKQYIFSCKTSKYFKENSVHGDEAILSEKWAFRALCQPSPDEKSGRRRPNFAHTPYFRARFLLKFCPFSRFCKHAKFSKVNAKFSKGVDFSNQLTISYLVNSQKTGVFSSKSCFRGEFLKYGGQKWPFCQFCSKKRSPTKDGIGLREN